jgi:GTP-binding protein
VADYPFTTVAPVLGTLETDDRQLVIADIPGLIEGAAQGAGLGHEFLAHVERCQVLVHLVEIAGEDPVADYEAVRRELRGHGAGLERLPELVVLSKRDLVPDDRAQAAVSQWRERLGAEALGVLAASSVSGAGLEEVRRAILDAVPDQAGPAGTAPPPAADPEFEAEHVVYRPAGGQGFDVRRVGDRSFEVEGRGIELLVRRHDLSNPEALAYLEQRLAEIGVISALRSAGFEAGDEVRIGEAAFELDPAA